MCSICSGRKVMFIDIQTEYGMAHVEIPCDCTHQELTEISEDIETFSFRDSNELKAGDDSRTS